MDVRKTVAEIISDAAIQLGQASAEIADPYASSVDKTITQLCGFLKSEGRRLARKYNWGDLVDRHTFATVASTASYALPSDFGRLVDGTTWDITGRTPILGPMSPQEWQAVQAGAIVAQADTAFRIFGGLFYLSPTPSSIRTIAFEYISTAWSGTTFDDPEDEPDPKAASPVFDGDLLVCAIKLKWAEARGLPTVADLRAEYDAALEEALGAQEPQPILSIRGRNAGSGLISARNVPDTGYGT